MVTTSKKLRNKALRELPSSLFNALSDHGLNNEICAEDLHSLPAYKENHSLFDGN